MNQTSPVLFHHPPFLLWDVLKMMNQQRFELAEDVITELQTAFYGSYDNASELSTLTEPILNSLKIATLINIRLKVKQSQAQKKNISKIKKQKKKKKSLITNNHKNYN